MKKRRTSGAVKVTVGKRNPKLFLVPKKTAESVVELLRPYQHRDETPISADEVFESHHAEYGRGGTVLRGFRAREGMTQLALAKKLRVTQGDVSAMENGRRPIGKSMAARLAKVFKTDYRVFL